MRFCRTLVLSPDRALKLQCAHTLLSFAEQQDGHKPDRQWQVGIIENRTSGNGELVNTRLAEVNCLRESTQPDTYRFWQRGQFNALRPAKPIKNLAAVFVGREHRFKSGSVMTENLVRRKSVRQADRLKSVPLRNASKPRKGRTAREDKKDVFSADCHVNPSIGLVVILQHEDSVYRNGLTRVK